MVRGGCERDGESRGEGEGKEGGKEEKEDNECLGCTFKAFTLSYMIFF